MDSTDGPHKVKVSNGARSKEAVDKLVGEIEKSEAEARVLLRDLKKFFEVQDNIRKSEIKLVSGLRKNSTVSGAKSASAGLVTVIHRWSDFLQDLKSLVGKLDSASSDSLKEYLGLISTYRAGVKRLDNAVQDQARASARWKKVEKEGKYSVTTAKLAELTRELTEAEIAVDSLTAGLERKLQCVLDKSNEFFPPLMTTIAANQRELYQVSYKEYDCLSRVINQQSSISERELEERTRNLLMELDALSIVDKPKDAPSGVP
ncbi:hypothetical protein RvY_04612 [Ramazzottius varieornatus]|uniref:BAR domain-containing protein n=1 Tax=Ramazzottius varieornatus TaxID=947166 RepID=A0A1D1V1D8_RAMVA|nr:hypothetical protein RvY_04612 [Ramazzottius varieornatus]